MYHNLMTWLKPFKQLIGFVQVFCLMKFAGSLFKKQQIETGNSGDYDFSSITALKGSLSHCLD